MPKQPKILGTSVLAESRLFTIEAVELEFANGRRACFERVLSSPHGVVMVIARNQQQELVMVREYAAGSERYELGFVKGRVDPGEQPQHAAQRELQEEVGLGAKRLKLLRAVSLNPGYSNFKTFIYLATELYPQQRPGDEVEPLEQVLWPLARVDELHQHAEVNDARVLLGVFLLQQLARGA